MVYCVTDGMPMPLCPQCMHISFHRYCLFPSAWFNADCFLVVSAFLCRSLSEQVCRYPAFEAEVSANPKLSMFILQGMVSCRNRWNKQPPHTTSSSSYVFILSVPPTIEYVGPTRGVFGFSGIQAVTMRGGYVPWSRLCGGRGGGLVHLFRTCFCRERSQGGYGCRT